LAESSWKRKRQQRILSHGGCGSGEDRVNPDGFNTQTLRSIKPLRHLGQLQMCAIMNKTGLKIELERTRNEVAK
jgi:hypothetical protein